MILTSYQQSYAHFTFLASTLLVTYPDLYRDIKKLYRTYAQSINENVSRETLTAERGLVNEWFVRGECLCQVLNRSGRNIG
jgi:capsid protein